MDRNAFHSASFAQRYTAGRRRCCNSLDPLRVCRRLSFLYVLMIIFSMASSFDVVTSLIVIVTKIIFNY